MEFLHSAVDLFLHLDKHLDSIIQNYGVFTYIILFLIIFAETGLVITPFLPGDSLLFAAGMLASRPTSPINVVWLFVLLTIAAILGDTVNYWIGKFFGPRIFRSEKARFLKRDHLEKTHAFFEKYGGKTIVIARFTPIVRTLAPFVAGVGSMTYSKFLFYNITGGILWVGVCVFGGYLFGNIPLVQKNFSLVTLLVIFLSLIPIGTEMLKSRREKKQRFASEEKTASVPHVSAEKSAGD
jgi:membrane-associated protein